MATTIGTAASGDGGSGTTLSWAGFLKSLRAGIGELQERVEQSRNSDREHPVRRLGREEPPVRAHEIAIGRGRYPDRSVEGICLNNKAANSLAEARWYDSVTALALDPPPPVDGAWRTALGETTLPRDFLRSYVLLVEDASPDSCLGLILFLARAGEVAVPPQIEAMIAHVRAWEQGMSYGIDRPERCYGVLHNALVHRLFDSSWGEAWVDGLSLCAAALEGAVDPMNVTELPAAEGRLRTARSFVAYERESYLDTLRQGETVQLLLPMQGRLGRYRMVDALIATETNAIGANKIFVRNDREHTWFQDGFALYAVHRPPAVGDGGDVTISTTPEVGLELRDLWRRLEELEDEAWKGARPDGAPRQDIHLYPGGRRADGRSSGPTEPWYINRGENLIGAPRGLPPHPAGTRLGWQEICEALWSTYNPYAGAIVEAPNKSRLPLHEFPPETARDETATRLGRHLAIATWPGAGLSKHGEEVQRPQYLVQRNPTLNRYLAACIQRWSGGMPPARVGIRLCDLPNEQSLATLPLSGGFAVICREGAFILNDFREDPVNRSEIRHEFENACAILKMILDETDKIGQLVRDVEAHLSPNSPGGMDEMSLLLRLSRMRTRIMTRWAETMNQTLDADTRRFRDVLHEAWGIRGRLEDFYRAVDEVSSILQAHGELQTNRLIARLTVLGYPLALAAAFFGFIFSDLGTEPSRLWSEFGSIRWNGVIVYCLMAAAGVVLIHLAHKLSVRRRWRKHVDQP